VFSSNIQVILFVTAGWLFILRLVTVDRVMLVILQLIWGLRVLFLIEQNLSLFFVLFELSILPVLFLVSVFGGQIDLLFLTFGSYFCLLRHVIIYGIYGGPSSYNSRAPYYGDAGREHVKFDSTSKANYNVGGRDTLEEWLQRTYSEFPEPKVPFKLCFQDNRQFFVCRELLPWWKKSQCLLDKPRITDNEKLYVNCYGRDFVVLVCHNWQVISISTSVSGNFPDLFPPHYHDGYYRYYMIKQSCSFFLDGCDRPFSWYIRTLEQHEQHEPFLCPMTEEHFIKILLSMERWWFSDVKSLKLRRSSNYINYVRLLAQERVIQYLVFWAHIGPTFLPLQGCVISRVWSVSNCWWTLSPRRFYF